MNVLFVGALSWNPERVVALANGERNLYGLWSRTMGWEQGPYAFASGLIVDVNLEEAVDLLRHGGIDIVYSLFQVYDSTLWAPEPAAGVEDHWDQLRRLIEERDRGTFDVPIVRHWGFDIHKLDLGVVRALDGQIFCNRQQFDFWTLPAKSGGCGLDLGHQEQEIAFLDGDQPSREFMTESFAPKLSASDGEVHTVCVGRPLGIDFLAAARNRIHLHVYGNNFDEVASTIAQGLSRADISHVHGLISDYLHVHRSIQPAGSSLEAIRKTKSRWVEEFSRYDAGWSYVGRPLPWSHLENQAAIPNRLGTYLLAGLPVIAEKQPGFYRYEVLAENGVVVEFTDANYARLAERLRAREELAELSRTARRVRHLYSFDATIPHLLGFFERAARRRERGRTLTAVPDGERSAVCFPTSPSFLGIDGKTVRPGGPSWSIDVLAHRARRRIRHMLGQMFLNDYVSWALRSEDDPKTAALTVDDIRRPQRVAVIERFPQPSRNCGIDGEDVRVIRLGGDAELMKPDGRRKRAKSFARLVTLPLRCLGSVLRVALDGKVSMRNKLRLIVAALGTRGASWEALAGVHHAVRLLRSEPVDRLDCYTARGFPLVPMLSGLFDVPYREFLSMNTRYFGEFAFELLAVVPYAYWLHRNGRLRETQACCDTNVLYYFSPKHREFTVPRTYVPISEYPSIPAVERRFDVHSFPQHIDASHWIAPPYKEIYSNSTFVWDKPLCIVCNKYTPEPSTSSQKAVNFMPVRVVMDILEILHKAFQVVYVRPRPGDIVDDHQPIGDLGDLAAIESRFPGVLTIQQIGREHPDLSFNELQMKLFANCDRFVSVLGGSAFLASYFGGRNVVYANEGWEVSCNAYENWFDRFSGAQVFHTGDLDQLVELVRREIVD